MTRISTIVPTFNRADLIGETLRSVLEQSRPPDELIVIDDGSTDGTPDVVKEFGSDVVYRRQSNSGPAAARNAGLSLSTGDVIHFMDSDDLCTQNNYASQLAEIEAGADIAYGPWLKTRIENRTLYPEAFAIQQGPVPRQFDASFEVMLTIWSTVLQACLIKRELIEKVGNFREDLWPSDDLELLYRLLAARPVAAHTTGSLLLYRVHPDNQVSIQDPPKRVRDLARLWAVMEEHLALRPDLNSAERRRFFRRKVDITIEALDAIEDRADFAFEYPSMLQRITSKARQSHSKMRSRLRARLTGNPYLAICAAAPLRQDQIEAIDNLGYSVAREGTVDRK